MTVPFVQLRKHDGVHISQFAAPHPQLTVELWVWAAEANRGRCCALLTKTSDAWDRGFGLVCERLSASAAAGGDDQQQLQLCWFVFPRAGNALRVTARLQPSVWTHVAATFDGKRALLFLNGTAAASSAAELTSSSSFSAAATTTNADDLRLGVTQNGKHRVGFVGSVAELRVWCVARTPDEIVACMKSGPGLDAATAAALSLHVPMTPDPWCADGSRLAVFGSAASAAVAKLVHHAKLSSSVRDDDMPFAPSYSLRALCMAASAARRSPQLPLSPSMPSLDSQQADDLRLSVPHVSVTVSAAAAAAAAATATSPRVKSPSGRMRRTSSAPDFADAPVPLKRSSDKAPRSKSKPLSGMGLSQDFSPASPSLQGATNPPPIGSVTTSVQTLRFGIGELAPIGTEVKQRFVVANTTPHKVTVQLPALQGHSFALTFSPPTVSVKSKGTVEVTAAIILRCTTTVRTKVGLRCFAEKRSGIFKKKKDEDEDFVLPLGVEVQSVLSLRLDHEDIELKSKCGEGAYSTVYRARWRGIDVAMKKMSPALMEAGFASTDFGREIELLEKIRCPYIVTFLGAIVTPGHFAIVTEFVPLGSLAELLKKQKVKDNLLKLRIAENAAKGVCFLHMNSVIHRDIKTANVLVVSLDPHTTEIVAKLADFGSSRITALKGAAMTAGVGSPIWMHMAPEILEGTTSYDKAADTYSFGLLMWELWSEKQPFTGPEFEHPWDVTSFVTKGKHLPIDPKQTPPNIVQLINESWHLNPARRPAFPQIVDALERLLP